MDLYWYDLEERSSPEDILVTASIDRMEDEVVTVITVDEGPIGSDMTSMNPLMSPLSSWFL